MNGQPAINPKIISIGPEANRGSTTYALLVLLLPLRVGEDTECYWGTSLPVFPAPMSTTDLLCRQSNDRGKVNYLET